MEYKEEIRCLKLEVENLKLRIQILELQNRPDYPYYPDIPTYPQPDWDGWKITCDNYTSGDNIECAIINDVRN